MVHLDSSYYHSCMNGNLSIFKHWTLVLFRPFFRVFTGTNLYIVNLIGFKLNCFIAQGSSYHVTKIRVCHTVGWPRWHKAHGPIFSSFNLVWLCSWNNFLGVFWSINMENYCIQQFLYDGNHHLGLCFWSLLKLIDIQNSHVNLRKYLKNAKNWQNIGQSLFSLWG